MDLLTVTGAIWICFASCPLVPLLLATCVRSDVVV